MKFADSVPQLRCIFSVFVSTLFGMYLCRHEFIARPVLPALSLLALSTLHCLHADSITRAIYMMYFTGCFYYLRNPYPQNVLYPQFHYTCIKSTPV